jgi:hypothetical protein
MKVSNLYTIFTVINTILVGTNRWEKEGNGGHYTTRNFVTHAGHPVLSGLVRMGCTRIQVGVGTYARFGKCKRTSQKSFVRMVGGSTWLSFVFSGGLLFSQLLFTVPIGVQHDRSSTVKKEALRSLTILVTLYSIKRRQRALFTGSK